MACCDCCAKTGACCTDEGCAQETCADCEAAGGQFQGVDTECVDGDCPCDPPADKSQCQKCVDGEAVPYCPEAKPSCRGGVCQAESPCDPPCDSDNCEECVDGECVSTCSPPETFCCINQNGVRGCFPDRTGNHPSCDGADWCSNCVASAGGVETRYGPFATDQEAIAECNSVAAGCNGIPTTLVLACPEGYYCYLCCDEDVP